MNFTIPQEDQPVISIIRPNLLTGPWIAGGAVLQWFLGKSVDRSDIDVFFQDQEQFDETLARLRCNNGAECYVRFESDNAVTLDYYYTNYKKSSVGSRIPWLLSNNEVQCQPSLTKSFQLQLIRRDFFKDAADVLNRFDLTVCQFLTDGKVLLTGPTSINDVKNRRIVANRVHPGIIKRVLKYNSYGYKPSEEINNYILNNPEVLTDFSGSNEYDNAF